jgi:aldehyde dehydrogenase (NAD+)
LDSHNVQAATTTFLSSPDKQHFIHGEWVRSLSGESIETFNPATGEVLVTLARGRKEDIDVAVTSARRAFRGPWAKFAPAQRQQLIMRFAELFAREFDELTMLESLDMGAPLMTQLRPARTRGLQTILYYAAQARNITSEHAHNSLPGDVKTMLLKAPVGVVGGIIPWNGPLFGQMHILGPVLATGCTAILKPAEDASLTVLRTAELLIEAGLPPGVVNVVTGLGAEAGAALAAHPGVNRIAFTGSTDTGREIIKASAGNMKRLQLELGGKSPDIVFADADSWSTPRKSAFPGIRSGSARVRSRALPARKPVTTRVLERHSFQR